MQPGRWKIKTSPQNIASDEFLQLEKPNMFVSQNQITYQTSEIISKHLSFQYCFLPSSLAQPHTPAHTRRCLSQPASCSLGRSSASGCFHLPHPTHKDNCRQIKISGKQVWISMHWLLKLEHFMERVCAFYLEMQVLTFSSAKQSKNSEDKVLIFTRKH